MTATRLQLLFLCIVPVLSWGAQGYYTHPVDEAVHTLRVLVDGDFRRQPVVDVEGNAVVEVSFDVLADEREYLSYRVEHCGFDWEPSGLMELDYAEGFMPVRVADVRPSFNTFVPYWHYSVAFPNDDVRLLLSGNYAVLFHRDGAPDDVVAVATFSVSEQMAFVSGEVSANTDVDFMEAHQQLSLALSWSQRQLPMLDPAGDVTLVVEQNRRRDTRRQLRSPSRIEAHRAVYEHVPGLLFEAGNTWRRFEFVDVRYATLGVESVRYHAPYHHVRLTTSHPRAASPYLYDQDQHGRFLITARRVDDADTEADYFWAQFVLDCPLMAQTVYLEGDFTYGERNGRTLMRYDGETDSYAAEVLLKQGAYNYQYVTLDGPEAVYGRTDRVEGDHYETQNEYGIWVYYRPPGARYDRLLGVAVIGATMP